MTTCLNLLPPTAAPAFLIDPAPAFETFEIVRLLLPPGVELLELYPAFGLPGLD